MNFLLKELPTEHDLQILSQGQETTILLEPGNVPFIFGHDFRHPAPELAGMIPDLCMDEFVHHYIIDDFRRCQHQSPGKAECSTGTA
jgi:hypothetical protein